MSAVEARPSTQPRLPALAGALNAQCSRLTESIERLESLRQRIGLPSSVQPERLVPGSVLREPVPEPGDALSLLAQVNDRLMGLLSQLERQVEALLPLA